MTSAESEARKALNRLRRALEKAERELDSVRGALMHAEGDDFPSDSYDEVSTSVQRALDFTDEEGVRLQEKVLHAGGLEPGRIRRS